MPIPLVEVEGDSRHLVSMPATAVGLLVPPLGLVDAAEAAVIEVR